MFLWNSWDHMAIEDCRIGRFPADYAHMNTMQLVDGDIIASFRGCAQVLRIDEATGAVEWRLGRSTQSDAYWETRGVPAPLKIVGDPYVEFCGQHSAKLLPNGHLMLFGNGYVCRPDPVTGQFSRVVEQFSRVVEYALDLENGQATFVRHHSLHDGFNMFAQFEGHVESMDNGNWLISWGLNIRFPDLLPDTSVTEYNPTTDQELLSVTITSTPTGPARATRAYPLGFEALADLPPFQGGPRGGGSGGVGGGGGGGPRTSAPSAPRNLTAVGGDGEAVLTWDAPASAGGAAITDYEYRINGSNPWISIGSTLTTHTVSGLVNGTAYVFEVRAVNAGGKSFPSSQAEAAPEAPEVLTLDFAHFANGGGITSDLVFVNAGSVPVRPAIYFYDTEGDPIAAESVVDLTGDLAIQEDGALTVLTDMEPLEVLTVSTHGRGDLVSGSVKVVADGPLVAPVLGT